MCGEKLDALQSGCADYMIVWLRVAKMMNGNWLQQTVFSGKLYLWANNGSCT